MADYHVSVAILGLEIVELSQEQALEGLVERTGPRKKRETKQDQEKSSSPKERGERSEKRIKGRVDGANAVEFLCILIGNKEPEDENEKRARQQECVSDQRS